MNKPPTYYLDVKHDISLCHRFYEAVRILATNTGKLNKRIFDAYNYYLRPFELEHFRETELEQKLEYIHKILNDPSKCTYYQRFPGGNLHCHWKESKQIAENIFFIYTYVVRKQNEK